MIARLRQAAARGATMHYLGIGEQPTLLGRRLSVVAYVLGWTYIGGVLVAMVVLLGR